MDENEGVTITQGENGRAAGRDYIENNFFLFKLSPLFIKIFNDTYDVRKAIIRFATFSYLAICFIGFVATLYVFKIKGSDLSFDLIGTFLFSIIILVLYNIFNNIFYMEFERFKKCEKIIFLLFLIWWCGDF